MKYKLSVFKHFSSAHALRGYKGKCENLHGHNWVVVVYCKSKELNDNGMVTDFAIIKKMISEKFDHQYFNNIPPFDKINPTAENMAREFCNMIPNCYKVSVQESEGNIAIYEKEED